MDDELARRLSEHQVWIDSVGRLGVQLRWDDLDLSRFGSSDLDLSEAVLPDARGAGLRIDRWQLYGAMVPGLELVDAEVNGCPFNKAFMPVSEFRRCVFTRCEFIRPDLTRSVFEDVTFVDCRLIRPDLVNAQLTRVVFQGSELDSCAFEGSTFERVDLVDCTLTGPFFVDGAEAVTRGDAEVLHRLERTPPLPQLLRRHRAPIRYRFAPGDEPDADGTAPERDRAG